MNPRRTVTTRQAASAFAGTLGLLTLILLLQHPAIFLWVIVVGGFIGCAWWIVLLHEQRDGAAAKWADETFKRAAAEHANRRLKADFDALVARHAEVLVDHAECPAPVSVR